MGETESNLQTEWFHNTCTMLNSLLLLAKRVDEDSTHCQTGCTHLWNRPSALLRLDTW